MKQRAQEKPASHAPADQAKRQFLTFTLDGELFALGIARIREVVELAALTRIPMAPAAVPGVINLRGAVVPVVDLASRLGRERGRLSRRTCVIVVDATFEGGAHPIGLIVDGVREAIAVDAQRIDARPAFGTGLRADFVASMIACDGDFVPALELDSVLALVELEAQVMDSARAARTTGARTSWC